MIEDMFSFHTRNSNVKMKVLSLENLMDKEDEQSVHHMARKINDVEWQSYPWKHQVTKNVNKMFQIMQELNLTRCVCESPTQL